MSNFNPNVIGIVGVKQSGKDTTANYLIENYGYIRYSFADPLKRGCMEMFGFTPEQMWGTGEQKEAIDPVWNISPRRMLQLIGTELLQMDIHKHLNEGEFNIGRKIWVLRFKNWYLNEIKKNPDIRIVISDVRFPHEAEILHDLGAMVWRVERASLTSIDEHPSEIEQRLIKEDVLIHNDSTLQDLYHNVDIYLKMNGMKDSDVLSILRNSIIEFDPRTGYSIDIYKIKDVVLNWPLVSDGDGDIEPLDLENWGIMKITDSSFVMSCGGDWQDPLILTMVPVGDKLKVIMKTEGFDDSVRGEDIVKLFKDRDESEAGSGDYEPGDRFKPGD